MNLLSRQHLQSVLMTAALCLPCWAQGTLDDVKVVADRTAPISSRRGALRSCLKKASPKEMEALMREFWRPGVLSSFLSPSQVGDSNRVEFDLCSCPEFIRFLGALFSHPNKSQRLSAIAWSQNSTWPWLLRRRLRAFEAEGDPDVVKAHLQQIRGNLKAEEITAVLSKVGAERDNLEAVFRLGLARAPGTQRVQAWPGAQDWIHRGFSANPSDAPFRRLTKPQILLPCPVARNTACMLLGIRRKSKNVRGLLTVFLKSKEIGKFAIGTGASLDQVIALRLPQAISLIGQELRMDLAPRLVNEISFRALVAVEQNVSLGNPVISEQVLGASHVSLSFHVEKAEAPTGGVVLKGKSGHLVVQMPEFDRQAHRVDLDHWARGQKPAVWDVALNGKPLVRLISQRLPRAAKCFPRGLTLKPGRNELIFTRISGGDLYIEAIRFVR